LSARVSRRRKNARPTKAKATNSICHQTGKPSFPARTHIIPEIISMIGSLNLIFLPKDISVFFFWGRDKRKAEEVAPQATPQMAE
jgi:hypothetical protein